MQLVTSSILQLQLYNIVQEVTDCLCNSMAKIFITWPNIKECTIIEEGFRVRANFHSKLNKNFDYITYCQLTAKTH